MRVSSSERSSRRTWRFAISGEPFQRPGTRSCRSCSTSARSCRAAREVAEAGAGVVGISMVFTARAREFADLATEAARARPSRRHRRRRALRGVPRRSPARTGARDRRGVHGEGEEPLCRIAADPTALASVPGSCGARRRARAQLAAAKPRTSIGWRCRRARCRSIIPVARITNLVGSRGCVHGARSARSSRGTS